ncbi:multidrug resistance-associated protein 1, partial [Aphelenchoides avenae]
MIVKGYRGPVELDEIWALEKQDRADFLRSKFISTAPTEGRRGLLSYFLRLVRCTWVPLGTSVFWCLLISVLFLTPGFILGPALDSLHNEEPLWVSLLWVSLICVISFISRLLFPHSDMYNFYASMNVGSILTSAIFDKMLKLSPAVRTRISTGELLNMVTTDIERIREFWSYVSWGLVANFMEMGISVVGLFLTIGHNTFYGLAVMMLVFPINYFASKIALKFE